LQYIRAVRVIVVVVLALGVVACGAESDYANKPRPPAPISVTAAIDKTRIRISPRTFGGGPVVFIISNQSGAEQKVTFESDGSENGGIRRATGAIEPRSTANLKVDAPEGTYTLSASGGNVAPATIEVGKRRPSSQNDLLLP
jgi:hypothetical protein